MKTLKIDNKKLLELLNIEAPKFAKYSGPLMNLANRFIGGTKPKVVGQMSELIKEFDGKTFKEWETWYLNKYPKAIAMATEKIYEHAGGGCSVGVAAKGVKYQRDDVYVHKTTNRKITVYSTTAAHFKMPRYVSGLAELLKIKGVVQTRKK